MAGQQGGHRCYRRCSPWRSFRGALPASVRRRPDHSCAGARTQFGGSARTGWETDDRADDMPPSGWLLRGSASPRTGTLSIVCVLCPAATGNSRTRFRFGPILGALDDHLLIEGTHQTLYERLGAHPMTVDGVDGVHFAVWAPNAARVSVVGDFNAWDGRRHPMRKRIDSGLWEIFTPGIGEGARLQIRDRRRRRNSAAAEGRPLRASRRNFARERVGGCSHRTGFPGPDVAYLRQSRQGRSTRRRSHLRSASGLMEARARHARLSDLPRPGRAVGRVLSDRRLHARRAATDQRAPVRPILGLPDCRPITRRPAASARPTISSCSWTSCTRPASASCSTGFRPTFRAIRTAWPTSTGPPFSNTPIRARANIPTGAPRSSTTTAPRCAAS